MHSNQNIQQASEIQIRPNPELQPWAVKPPKPDELPAVTKITDAFRVEDKDSSFYNRKTPEHFSTTADDRLMWSIIQKFSVEGNTNGSPNGHFYLTPKGMEQVAREVVQTHYGWTGNKREFYLRDNLPRIWAYHDILNEGFVDASNGPVILKSLIGDAELNNGLQL